MSLVEPDIARLGWGVVKFAGLLQVREVVVWVATFSELKIYVLCWINRNTNISANI